MALPFLAVALAIGLVVSGCDRPRRSGEAPVRFRVAYTSAVDVGDLPSLIAHRRLAEAGYRVETCFFAQSEMAADALAGGDAEIGNGSSRTFWAAIARGADVVTLMEHTTDDVVLVAGPGVAGYEGLHRRRLGVHSPGSVGRALLDTYLARCPEARPDIFVVPGSGNRAAALERGVLDAALLKRADVVATGERIPGRFRTLFDFGAAHPEVRTSGVHVRRRFAAEHPDAVRAYVRARVEANRLVSRAPAAIVEEAARWPALGPVTPAILAAQFAANAWDRDGGLTRENVRRTLDFFVRSGALPASLVPERVADLSVLEAVGAELGAAAGAAPGGGRR